MHNMSVELTNKLSLISQRKLEKGELFLLAKAIADSIPLAPTGLENISIYILNHRRFIDSVIFTINHFSYIDEDNTKTLIKLIEELSLWRYNIAHEPPSIFFTGEANTVIDDISCINRYVNNEYLCSVSDIAQKANWVYNTFKDLTKEVKLSFMLNGQAGE